MSLCLMYITNMPSVALVAESNGVDRIWVDLEVLGKEERQKNMNCVKSHHTIEDVRKIANVLTKAELMVRVNPWNAQSFSEIEQVVEAGAKRIMLPMWKTLAEVREFLKAVNGRVATTLLLETKEAVEIIDDVLSEPLVDEIHIGLNDLHLSYGKSFMFELLSDGTVDFLCDKMRKKGIAYGFGGVARLGAGMLSAEKIIMEHYRVGSTRAILSRSFCDACKMGSLDELKEVFRVEMDKLRAFERKIEVFNKEKFVENSKCVIEAVNRIVAEVKGAVL